MAHYLLNLAEPYTSRLPALRERAAARLRVNMWGVDAPERHRDSLAPGDLILIYLAEPERAFIGRPELVSSVREWTPSEANAYPDDSAAGVLLSGIEEWDLPLPMDSVLPRIDPDGSNPIVQANAKYGFEGVSFRSPPLNMRPS